MALSGCLPWEAPGLGQRRFAKDPWGSLQGPACTPCDPKMQGHTQAPQSRPAPQCTHPPTHHPPTRIQLHDERVLVIVGVLLLAPRGGALHQAKVRRRRDHFPSGCRRRHARPDDAPRPRPLAQQPQGPRRRSPTCTGVSPVNANLMASTSALSVALSSWPPAMNTISCAVGGVHVQGVRHGPALRSGPRTCPPPGHRPRAPRHPADAPRAQTLPATRTLCTPDTTAATAHSGATPAAHPPSLTLPLPPRTWRMTSSQPRNSAMTKAKLSRA